MGGSINSIPKIMGILNGTPDSFFQGSRIDNNLTNNTKYKYADIVDIGFESSRPGAFPLSEKDEISRFDHFLAKYPSIHHTLSIDTYKPSVARLALENGFYMINDVMGGGKNGEMLEMASFYNCPIVIMHMKGDPSTMQYKPFYDNIIDDLLYYFEYKIKSAKAIGIEENKIILDPGIGFGKRVIDNDIIINNINKLKTFGLPVLIGVSRKSFLSIADDSSEDRLPASLGATIISVQNGADIIRTHDIEDTYRMLSVACRIQQINYQESIF